MAEIIETDMTCPELCEYLYKRPVELTDEEKWQCTVRWLNRLYRAYITKEYPEEDPCANCQIAQSKCVIDRGEPFKHGFPPQANFKILERFTGEDTVIGFYLGSGS